ncbi:MAG TPA: SDR family NAD(P)-dependent oxidoreductase [Xanthobacteraceae bacterium]|nr:SDR family NAD(P)-dependent oxidoreductase [Xanthobacteraceae bacterium]
MKRIVITGAQGFIGTALAKRLVRDGYALRLVSRSPRPSRLDTPRNTQIDYVAADLRDPRAWSQLLDGADAVVHLSSRTDLRAAEADPRGDDDINIAPIRALAEVAAKRPTSAAVIFASTVTVAGAHPKLPVDESARDDPCSVYDRHKQICETILREATGRGALRACTLRLSNVYGYGSALINANRGILNVMINRAMSGEPLTLYGDGAYVRDFTHLGDVVEAFRIAIAKPAICDGRHYVITSGQGNSLAQAYDLIAAAALQHTGRRGEIRRVAEPRDLHPIEKRNFVGNSRLFGNLTGWSARFDLQAGIRDYFERVAAQAKTGSVPDEAA